MSLLSYLLLTASITVACQSQLLTPPRVEDAATPRQIGARATVEPLYLPAATATQPPITASPASVGAPNKSLTVWINESSDEHERALQAMLDEFEQESAVDVELILVSPMLLPRLMETAVLSDTVPGIVLHPIAYTSGWAERNILDASLSDEIVEQLGRDTFDPEALDLVTRDGLTVAIPSDGYRQLLIYRNDWLEAHGLEIPDNYESMMAAAETLYDPEAIISGIVIPTEANLATTHQAFEQLAAANGCELIDEKGEILILEPECQAALDFYFTLVNRYSPIGVQTDTSARNAFLSGRTAMIMSTPSMLPKLAGLDESVLPTCPECQERADYLARESGILTRIYGVDASNGGASFGEITLLGITHAADDEAAVAFVHYWFNEGYADWLGIESERKVPMRWGTASQPRRFIDAWGVQPLAGTERSLADIYGLETIMDLREGIAASSRWALGSGQGALLTEMYEEFTLPIVLQEMLSGYFGSSQTLSEMYVRITDLIPNYEYYIELESTPES